MGECEAALTKIWGFLAQKECSSSTVTSLPPALCKLVGNKALETKAIDAVCTKQSKVPAAECEAVLTKVWDTVAKAECASNTVAALPPMVCQLVENASLEKKAVDFVCSKQKEVPSTECEAALTKI